MADCCLAIINRRRAYSTIVPETSAALALLPRAIISVAACCGGLSPLADGNFSPLPCKERGLGANILQQFLLKGCIYTLTANEVQFLVYLVFLVSYVLKSHLEVHIKPFIFVLHWAHNE